jgi:lipopolysaccharide export system protein LptA
VCGNRLKEMYKCFSSILLIMLMFFSKAQEKAAQSAKLIYVRQAESLSYDREKNNAQILRGNVICEHDGALLYCDTALIYEDKKSMAASGHIMITKGDSIKVTGDKLFYDGRTRIASLESNVKCVEKDMTLTTNILTFDVGKSVASYFNGGTIVNKQNTLTSRNGHYFSAGKETAFHYDVILTNPEYKINSDTLKYRITNKTAYFLGPSIIISKTDYIYCENGWYDTNKEKAQFSKNALLVTAQQKLKGDSLVYDRVKGIGKAYRNVTLSDTSQKSVIYGDYAEYRQKKSEALITKKAVYARVVDDDTLFIAADTLYHVDIDSVNNFLNAYHHVKIYKKNLQAVCDSASMNTKDSLLQLFNSPLLWSGNFQASSRIIKVDIGKNNIKGFQLDGRAFLIEEADTINKNKYNQLTGRLLEGTIYEDSIRRIKVSGNADIIYYIKNKNTFSGLNRTNCEEILLWFSNGEVTRASLRPKTSGKMEPMKEVNPESIKLKGFNWQDEKRPKSRLDLNEKGGKVITQTTPLIQ